MKISLARYWHWSFISWTETENPIIKIIKSIPAEKQERIQRVEHQYHISQCLLTPPASTIYYHPLNQTFSLSYLLNLNIKQQLGVRGGQLADCQPYKLICISISLSRYFIPERCQAWLIKPEICKDSLVCIQEMEQEFYFKSNLKYPDSCQSVRTQDYKLGLILLVFSLLTWSV